MFKILEHLPIVSQERVILELKSVQLTFYSEVSSYFTGETQKVLFLPSTDWHLAGYLKKFLHLEVSEGDGDIVSEE